MIAVVEILHAVEGKRGDLKEALSHLVPIARKSKGCLQYDLLEPQEKKGYLCVLMRFATTEDLKNHENSAYISEFVKRYANILYKKIEFCEWTPS